MSQLKPREPLQLTPLEERITVTFVVTKECNFRCRYCYMVGKHGHGRMSFEIAKAAIDYLIEDRKSFPQSQMTWEFIGGEPLLEVDLIEKIIDYFTIRSFELDHPWFVNHMFSFSTNGSLYHTPKFQQLIKQYGKRLDVGLTLDGPAHVHDMERQFPDGRGTHETILKNLPLWLKNAPSPSTKVTIARSTLPYVAESMLYLFSVGMEVIHANVVFENVWQDGDEDVFEEQLDILGDAIIEQGWWRTHECSLFDRMIGKPLDMSHNQNWCGAGRYMLAVDSQGLFYPCVRFTDHSLVNQKPWVVGNVKDGLDYDALLPFNQLSRSSQSNQECMNCEVASGCAWCQGFNYDDSGDLFKRATYICKMHKARVRANERFWKKIDALIEAKEHQWKRQAAVVWRQQILLAGKYPPRSEMRSKPCSSVDWDSRSCFKPWPRWSRKS